MAKKIDELLASGRVQLGRDELRMLNLKLVRLLNEHT